MWKEMTRWLKNKDTWYFRLVHACTHSYHDEILNFTGVERTNNEINAHLFDNVNDYMIKKQQGGKNFNDGRMKKINPSIMGVGRNLSRGGEHRHFAYLFQIADDALEMDVNKTLYTFYALKIIPMFMDVGRGAGKTKTLLDFQFDIFPIPF